MRGGFYTMRIVIRSILCAALLSLVPAVWINTEAHAGSLKESWYMSRGKANMNIKNYKAAIEAFEKLIEINPDNREALRLLGLAYERQGLTDKAIGHYDRYLERFPDDAEIAFKQARYLEDVRLSYRRDDAIEYYRRGLKTKPQSHENRRRLARLLAGNKKTIDEAADEYEILVKSNPRDAGLRAEYARLLGGNLDTVDDAIEQYRILLDQHPKDSAAHRELAAAYAWQGDNDRAIYQAQLALRYDSQDQTADQIRNALMKGREPLLKTGLVYLRQSGDDSRYDYAGYLLKAGGKTDITPFFTLDAEIGEENYRNDEHKVNGTLYKLSLQGRIAPGRRVDLDWKYHDFKHADADSEFLAQYSNESDHWLIALGIRREFKYDSLLSIAGEKDVSGQTIGAARSNTVFCKINYEKERLQFSVMPYGGYVSAESTDNNSLIGADADVRYRFLDHGPLLFAVMYKFQIYHYREDQSGLGEDNQPTTAGGYFSPYLFVNNALELEVSYLIQPGSKLVVSVGPSFQYWQSHDDQDERNTGVDLQLVYEMKLSRSLLFTTEGSYYQIASVYRGYDVTALVSYKF